MLPGKKIISFLTGILFASVTLAQHPDYKKIDSLRNILSTKHGIEKIDCLNAIGIEYWWPVDAAADNVSKWATMAYNETDSINYPDGRATAMMLLGVGEIFRRHCSNAEKYLRQALQIFEKTHNDFGLGWGNIWLGQALYPENEFEEALLHQKQSIPFLEKLNDWEGKGKAWAWMGMTYATLGNYDSSFFYSNESLLIRKKMSDHLCVFLSFINIGELFKTAGAYTDALDFYNEGMEYANLHRLKNVYINWTYFELVGNLYRMVNKPDSSYYYLRKYVLDTKKETTNISYGETLLMKGQVDSALAIFIKPIEDFRNGNDKWDLMRVSIDAAKAYMKKGEDKAALLYAREASSIADKSGAKLFMVESNLVLSKIYNALRKNDSAYFFLKRFTTLNDSMVNQQFLWKLSAYKQNEDFRKRTDELALLDKENKSKEEKLKEDSLLKWILIGCFLLVVFGGIVIYKNLSLKRKNEKLENRGKQAELQQHVAELEMQALRAQMNPHFIFNCLSSINRFILKNETEAASNYLTKFSRLIRMVLTNSKKPFISLEDELEMLGLYLDMEKLRFKDSFDYRITFINSIDTGNVFVPPLLLQPFAENAIWHGLMHKEGQGHLTIEFSIDENILTCAIIDNGVGRSKAAELKSKTVEKQNSMGIQITTERLALLNKDFDQQTFFNIEDITDNKGKSAGTRVILKMNFKNLAGLASRI